MKKVRIGVIGVGNISHSHIQGYKKLDNVELVAVCDINEQRAKEVAEKYGIPSYYKDLNMMLEVEQLDGVSVCTWNNGHYPSTIAALRAGVNVLCEKPLAMNTDQAIHMVDVAKEMDKLLMVGFVRRFGENVKLVKELINQGEFGEFYYAKTGCIRRTGNPGGWFSDKKRSGGGPLIDLGVHMIDLVWYLMDKPKVVSVTGSTFNKLGNRSNLKGVDWYKSADYSDYNDVEDAAVAIIKFDNDATVFVETSWAQHIKEDHLYLELFGTRGGAIIEPNFEIIGERNDYLVDYTPVLDAGVAGYGNVFDRETAHFVDCLANGTQCINPGEDGVELMRIIDAIYLSAEQNKEVIIER